MDVSFRLPNILHVGSVALNDREGGRFVDGGIYSHLMYGAFSGPL